MSRAPALDPQTTLTLRVLTVATFLVVLNNTIMVNALPRLMDDMNVGAPTVQWLVAGFMLTMAVVIPTTGWFLQRVGRRTAFVSAMSVFAVGTTVAGLAPTFEVLLTGRVIQAMGTAVMMPLLMSSVLGLVPPGKRGRIMGNVSLAISVAPALGPTVSGFVLAWGSWRWLFGLVLPLAIAVGVLGAWLLDPRRLGTSEDESAAQTRRGRRLDLPSILLTVIGFGGVVYGLSHLGSADGGENGALVPLLVLGVGVVGVALFAWRQVRLQDGGVPLLDLRVLLAAPYRLSVGMLALSFMGLMGAMILLPMYYQDVRGLSTLEAGLMLMPGGLAMGLLGPVVGRIHDRLGPAPLVIPGAVLLALGLGLLAFSATRGPWWAFLVLHLVMSVGLSLIFTPAFTTGLSALPNHLYEHGSALIGTLQQVAAAAGTALVITVMTVRSGALQASGWSPEAALGDGVGVALGVATVLAVLAVALSLLFLRRSTTEA